MIPDDRIAEAVSRLTGVPREELRAGMPMELPGLDRADSLDRVELMMELEDEFDEETIRWAHRFIQAYADRARALSRSSARATARSSATDPMWDRELDDPSPGKR
jgi:hypothetical protein